MRIIAFITETAPVEQILTHIGEPPRPPPISPARPGAALSCSAWVPARTILVRSFAASAQLTHPPGTRHPSRCRTGTSSSSPSPTSSSISASPGSRRLSRRERCSPARLPEARCPADARPSTPERARLHRPDVRQPRSWALTAHPTPANLLPRANLDAQRGLDFLSVHEFLEAGFPRGCCWELRQRRRLQPLIGCSCQGSRGVESALRHETRTPGFRLQNTIGSGLELPPKGKKCQLR
jgi:hypothetical protein